MIQIQQNISLAPVTTLLVGGPASYFAKVRSLEDMREAADFIFEKKVPYLVLGGSSNVLISDKGFGGFVIGMAIRGMKMKEKEGDYRRVEIEVGAGENWDDFVSFAVEQKLYGVENLSGIPGSVGASPVQNIGAYGTEVKEVIAMVETFDMETREVRLFSAEECEFAYRNSIFKKAESHRFIITKVVFVLEKEGRVNIGYKDIKERFASRFSKDVHPAEVRTAVLEIRAAKLPDYKVLPTAGSFFKNPIISGEAYAKLLESFPDLPSFSEKGDEKGSRVKIPLAWILDNVCDLRGWRKGNVGTYEKQPLVLVNYGGASSSEIEHAARFIADTVLEETGISIEWEVVKVGE